MPLKVGFAQIHSFSFVVRMRSSPLPGSDSTGSLLRQGGAQQGEEDGLRVGELTIGAERFVHHSPLWVGEVGPHEDGLQKEARA